MDLGAALNLNDLASIVVVHIWNWPSLRLLRDDWNFCSVFMVIVMMHKLSISLGQYMSRICAVDYVLAQKQLTVRHLSPFSYFLHLDYLYMDYSYRRRFEEALELRLFLYYTPVTSTAEPILYCLSPLVHHNLS